MKNARVLVTAALVVLGACGGTGTRTSGSVPSQDGAFVPGLFANLPKPVGAVAYEPPTHSEGVWAQSFHVGSLGSAETIQFYGTALGEGWGQMSAPAQTGTCTPTAGLGDGCTYQAVWVNSGQRLEISTSPDGSSTTNATELSLVLLPTS